jgi:hypothetical protein
MPTITGGITINGGFTLGASSGSYSSGSNGAIGYTEFNPPFTAYYQLEDGTATFQEPVGFTINDSTATGIAVSALTPANQTYYENLGTGTFTATFGAGSTHHTASVDVVSTPSTGGLIFFVDPGVSYPFRINFPITIA